VFVLEAKYSTVNTVRGVAVDIWPLTRFILPEIASAGSVILFKADI
jgi:hypothetical protein